MLHKIYHEGISFDFFYSTIKEAFCSKKRKRNSLCCVEALVLKCQFDINKLVARFWCSGAFRLILLKLYLNLNGENIQNKFNNTEPAEDHPVSPMFTEANPIRWSGFLSSIISSLVQLPGR